MPLMYVQIHLSEYVLQALMVNKNLKSLPIQVVVLSLQDVNNGGKFQVVGEVIFLMTLQLSVPIGYDLIMLYQNTTQSQVGGITVNCISTYPT